MHRMRNPRKASLLARLTTALALIATLGLGLATTTTAQPAQAATSTKAAMAVPAITGPFKQITKTILADTSIDGPALAGLTTGRTRAAIAWTGTDTERHLNVMISETGFGFYSKRILGDTSPYRPAVTMAPGGQVAIAWVGTDNARTLNVLYDIYGTPRKLILWGENSAMAPALTYENGLLYLAWTGQDAARQPERAGHHHRRERPQRGGENDAMAVQQRRATQPLAWREPRGLDSELEQSRNERDQLYHLG